MISQLKCVHEDCGTDVFMESKTIQEVLAQQMGLILAVLIYFRVLRKVIDTLKVSAENCGR